MIDRILLVSFLCRNEIEFRMPEINGSVEERVLEEAESSLGTPAELRPAALI